MILETGLDARIPRRRSLPLGLAALLVLGAAGCGSSSSGRGSASTTTAATTSNTAPVSSSATGSTSSLVAQGSLDLLTYNVAGLPQGLSSSNPVANTPQISPKLNAYAVVLAQEDFTYHTQLMSQALHPYQSSPQPVSSVLRPMNDGLNRFSQPPFSGHQRVTWAVSYGVFGHANDSLASKGYSFARHELAPGVEVDVYNLHADAGSSQGDMDARLQQFAQLAQDMATRSAGRPVIVAGDTNLKDTRPQDMQTLADFLGVLGLRDCARELGKPELIDRVMIRDGGGVFLTPSLWRTADEFVDAQGGDLSDHKAVHVTLDWAFYR
ncbi:MAG: hypothetical protein KDD82_23135 [Planctomycetes bacterium]|nr:hypothetical protein [Planctomycetota bacterium]